jgi:hypothetical protein
MFAVAVTSSDRMQRTHNSVRRLHLPFAFVNTVFSGKRTLKNIGGGPEEMTKELSDVLVKRRKAFLDQAIITTEITAFQILDELEKISTQVSNAGR